MPGVDNGFMKAPDDSTCALANAASTPPQSTPANRGRPDRWTGRVRPTAALCIAAMLLAAGSAGAQPVQVHPLIGKWGWAVSGKKCAETLTYRLDGTRGGSSGEEVTEAAFEVTPVPSLLGFYRLTETVKTSNGKPDCSGDVTAAGTESTVRFIQFNPPKDFLIVCKAESLKACYGPLQRMVPAP
jgi:hypothetical protein